MSRTGIPELTPSKRGRILALHEEGYSFRQIAEKIGNVAPSTCQKTVKRDEIHDTRNTLPRPGRPRATDERTNRRIV